MTTEEIVRRLPDFGLPDTFRKHGVLLIERRWVVRELPDMELLDLLAHCYGVLAMLVVDAHRRCGFVMRTFQGDSHDPKPMRTEHLDRRLPCMVATEEMRTVILHLGTGQVVTPARFVVTADPQRKEEVLARYGSKAGELSIRPGEDLLEASVRWFEMAKRVLVRDGYHLPFLQLVTSDGGGELYTPAADDRQALYVLMHRMASQVERIGAVGLIHTAEFWMAPPEDLKPGQMPSEVSTRREVLQVSAATCDGRLRVHSVEFSKNSEGKIELGKSWVSDRSGGWWGLLEPIREVWERWESRRKEGKEGGSCSGRPQGAP